SRPVAGRPSQKYFVRMSSDNRPTSPESELERYSALEESRRKLELIFNATHDFIFLIGVDYPEDSAWPRFRYEAVNQAYCDLTTRTREELIGRTLEEVLPPERATNARNLLTRVVELGEARYQGTDAFPRGILVSDVSLRVVERRDAR